jgi:hypothetical protein
LPERWDLVKPRAGNNAKNYKCTTISLYCHEFELRREFVMAETESKGLSEAWRRFLRRHWKMLVVAIVVIAVICVAAIIVFLWFVGHAQSTGLVPPTLGLWTMGFLLTFILHLIFWEVLFVGIPAIVVLAVMFYLWWKKLPAEEKAEYKQERYFFGTRSRATSGGGGGISFLIFIVFCIKIFVDGNWDAAFATWTFDYFVHSYLWAFILVLVVFGIPAALGAIWWLRREMKKKPSPVYIQTDFRAEADRRDGGM